MMPAVAKNVLPAPLETPLLRFGQVVLKPEQWQWTKSVKYRMVYAKIRKALLEGSLTREQTLVEVTSGSTGAALAYAGQLLGMPVELHAYPTLTGRKRAQIEEFGAQIVVHPLDTPITEILGEVREKVCAGGTWHLGQYDRPSTIAAYQDLCRETVEQLRAAEIRPDAFVCPVGTGGIIQAMGSALKQAFPGIRVVAIEPAPGSEIEGTRNTDCFHLGEKDPYDRHFPNEVIRVQHPEPMILADEIRLGDSASAAVAAATSGPWNLSFVLAPD